VQVRMEESKSDCQILLSFSWLTNKIMIILTILSLNPEK